MSKNKQSFQNILTSVDTQLDLYLVKKAPSIPANIKELIVKYGPYLIIVSLLISAPSILALFRVNSYLDGLGYMVGNQYSANYRFSLIILGLCLLLQALAIPGLLKRSLSSWRLLYYSVFVTALSSLINLNLISLLVGSLISFYLLFQIKSYYK